MDDRVENRECFAARQSAGGEEGLPTDVVKAICINDVGGTEKRVIKEGYFLVDFGIEGDTHGSNWHHQVSLLSYDKVKTFNERGANVGNGTLGENLVVEGLDFRSLPMGTRLYAGSAGLVMTRIGEECYNHYAIYRRMGECIMPKEGVFTKVVREGIIRPGDAIHVGLPTQDHPLTAAVVTLGGKGARGGREDESGPAAKETLEQAGYEVVETLLVPDESALLKTQLIRLSDGRQLDLILTSEGTGFSPRDQIPEAILAIADRSAPEIAEAIRFKSLQITDRTVLNRGVFVIRDKALVINLPGSSKAVGESLGLTIDSLEHGIRILRGSASEYARKQPGESWRESHSRAGRCKDMTQQTRLFKAGICLNFDIAV